MIHFSSRPGLAFSTEGVLGVIQCAPALQTGGYFRFINGWHLTMANWAPGEPTDNSCVYLDVDGMWKTGLCNMTMNSACLQSSGTAKPTIGKMSEITLRLSLFPHDVVISS